MINVIILSAALNLFYFSTPVNKCTNEFKPILNTYLLIKNTSHKEYVNDTLLEKKIISKIFSLPEVKEKNKYIDSLSHHKSSVSIIITRKPDNKNKNYWIQAGYNNQLRFEPYYNFIVNLKDLSVLFYDTLEDRRYTLKEWRKRSKI